MGSMNRVFLLGNVTRDPEIRRTPSGMAVSDIGVAVTESYKNKEGQAVESTCFTDVVVWGRTAELCGEYVKKGSQVMVEGRLQFDQWEANGEKRSRLRVRADRVQFLGQPRGRRAVAEGEGKARSAEEQGVVAAAGAVPEEMPF